MKLIMKAVLAATVAGCSAARKALEEIAATEEWLTRMQSLHGPLVSPYWETAGEMARSTLFDRQACFNALIRHDGDAKAAIDELRAEQLRRDVRSALRRIERRRPMWGDE